MDENGCFRCDTSRRGFFAKGTAGTLVGFGLANALSEAQAQQVASGGTVSDFAWGNALKRIKANGKIVFAQSGSPTPPLYYRDPSTNKPAGYDVEIAGLIAKDLGVEPVFEEAAVAARISGLQSGKYDVALGATANTPARAELVAFTRGYIPYKQVLLVGSTTKFQGPEELDNPKYTITAASSSTAEDTVRLLFPKANIKPMRINEAVLAVTSGVATASILELYLAGPFVRSQPSVKILGEPGKPSIIATEFGCLACSASEMGLRQWLDNWLYWYDSHGVLNAMYSRIMEPLQSSK